MFETYVHVDAELWKKFTMIFVICEGRVIGGSSTINLYPLRGLLVHVGDQIKLVLLHAIMQYLINFVLLFTCDHSNRLSSLNCWSTFHSSHSG